VGHPLDRNDDLIIKSLEAQTVQRDCQYISEEISMMMELGLAEAMENRKFVGKMFAAILKRT
jgi:predicted transcriptional regulator